LIDTETVLRDDATFSSLLLSLRRLDYGILGGTASLRRLFTVRRYFCKLACACILLATSSVAGTVRIYVVNNAGTTIEVIDPATNKVVQVIRGIDFPEAVHFSPDGKRLYVSDGAENVVDVLDRETGKILHKVPITGEPNDLAVSIDGKLVLVCIRDVPGTPDGDVPGALDIIDTKSMQKIKTIPMKRGLHDIVVTLDGKYAIAGSDDGKFASVIDLQSKEVAWEISFDRGVLPLAIESAPDGSARRVFMQLFGFNGFAVVDFATHKEVARIQLPEEPTGFFRSGGPSHGMGVAPDNKTLWVLSRPANAVFVYSLPELKLLGHVSLPEMKLPGHAPYGGFPH
jgi:YVTN family beta-propeller protein